MYIELTTRWVERKQNKQTKELKEGLEIEYYHDADLKHISNGIVKKDADGFYIDWEDTEAKTRFDGSEKTKSILERCGWEV